MPQDNFHNAISVIIPTINRETLADAITSVIKQTVPPAEIIVVDDSLASAVKEYSTEVRILKNSEKLGQVGSIKRGIEQSRGNIIALLDDDDSWKKKKLYESLKMIDTGDKYWLCFTLNSSSRVKLKKKYLKTKTKENINAHKNRDDILNYILVRQKIIKGLGQIQNSSLVFSKQLAIDFPMIESSFHTDLLWIMRLMNDCPALKIYCVNKKLVKYNRNPEQVSKKISPGQSYEFICKYSNYLNDNQVKNYLANFTVRIMIERNCKISEIKQFLKLHQVLNKLNYKTKIWMSIFILKNLIRKSLNE